MFNFKEATASEDLLDGPDDEDIVDEDEGDAADDDEGTGAFFNAFFNRLP